MCSAGVWGLHLCKPLSFISPSSLPQGLAVVIWDSGSKGIISSLSRALWDLLAPQTFGLTGRNPCRVLCFQKPEPCAGMQRQYLGQKLGAHDWQMSLDCDRARMRWQLAEHLQAQKFCVMSGPWRPLVPGKLHVTLWRVVRTPCQGFYHAPSEERSKACMWLRVERHLTEV